MTAKEKLLERVTRLSEGVKSSACSALARVHSALLEILPARFRVRRRRAQETLRLLEEREDPVLGAFRNAPEDDEPWTEADEAAMAEVEDDRAKGVPKVPLEEVERELGLG